MTDLVPYTAVAGGCSLLSKSPLLKPEGCPRFVRGDGAFVIAEDGRRFRDWECGLLSVMLGHDWPEVTRAIVHAAQNGLASLPLGHPLEQEVATQLRVLSGCEGQQVRWCVTGSVACTAAVRVARAITGRSVVVSIGYHGIDDWALAHTPPAWGVPDAVKPLTVAVKFNDLPAVERVFYGMDPGEEWVNRENPALSGDRIAAVIVEPATLDEPQPGYLPGLRRLCTRYGAALIFDECITAGRYPEFTAGRHYGIVPDLWVTSKCLANGLPLAAVVGTREWMRAFDMDFRPDYAAEGMGPTYISGTYHVPGVSLAAARATLDVWNAQQVGKRLQGLGSALRRDLRESIVLEGMGKHVGIKGPPYRLVLDCPDVTVKTFVLRGMLARGHVLGAGFNLMAQHSISDVVAAAEAFHDTLTELKRCQQDGTAALRAGRLVAQPYRAQA